MYFHTCTARRRRVGCGHRRQRVLRHPRRQGLLRATHAGCAKGGSKLDYGGTANRRKAQEGALSSPGLIQQQTKRAACPPMQGAFETGSRDVFSLTTPDLGPIRELTMGHDNKVRPGNGTAIVLHQAWA